MLTRSFLSWLRTTGLGLKEQIHAELVDPLKILLGVLKSQAGGRRASLEEESLVPSYSKLARLSN